MMRIASYAIIFLVFPFLAASTELQAGKISGGSWGHRKRTPPTSTVTQTVTQTPIPTHTPTALPFVVVSADDLGTLPFPCGVSTSDGGLSVALDNQRLWLFGDAFGPGFEYTSMTHAWDRHPVWEEPRTQTIPLNPQEAEYNASHTDSHYGLWVTGGTNAGDNRAVIFFFRVLAFAGWNWQVDYAGIGILDAGASMGIRLPTQFDATVWPSGNAEYRDGYWWALGNNGAKHTVVSFRMGDPTDPSSWSVWDGSGWAADFSTAKDLWGFIANPSLVWSPYLNRWVASYTTVTNSIYVQTAVEPQGPWSGHIRIADALPPTYNPDYCCVWWHLMHDPRPAPGGGELWTVTYARPLAPLNSEIRVIAVHVR